MKALARVSDSQFLSAGRDGAVRLWQSSEASSIQILEFKEHEGFVNSVAFIPSTEEYPRGIIVSGGSDKLINLYDMAEGRLCGTLIGHTDNVCKIQVFSRGGPFVMGSCSWDGSARCWTEELSPAGCLVLSPAREEIKGPCWSLLSLGKEIFVTAHADRNLRVWRGDRLVQSIPSAHRDVIRDLVALDSGCFVSVGNDGALKVWDSANGKALQTLEGAHPAFIYGLVGNGEDLIASFGEEGLIKIWRWEAVEGVKKIREEFCLRVPAMSVWSGCFLDPETLVVGASNGTIYKFSCKLAGSNFDEEAFSADLAAFDAAIHASKSAEIEKNALDSSVLRYPGERVGKVVMVKRAGDGVVEAHQWDGLEWQNLGEVVDPDSVKAPDFNFKVELDDTGRSYNLPFSWGENPYTVAKNFLERNDLPITYLDEVANFIVKSAGSPSHDEDKKTTQKELFLNEPALMVIDAWNAEGVASKLKSFGMAEISTESIAEALKSWPVDQLFPCLDWLRVEILKGDDASVNNSILQQVDLQRILEKTDSSRKEEIAAVTMTLRLFCNASARSSDAFDADSIIQVIGKCTQSLNANNATVWIPLLVGLLYNAHKQAQLDATKSMALLHSLLIKSRQTKLNDSEIDRICWLIKSCGGGAAPLVSAVKKELEARPQDFASKMFIFQ